MSEKRKRSSTKSTSLGDMPAMLQTMQEYTKLQGMMLYQLMALKSAVVPFTQEVMDLHRIGLEIDPEMRLNEWMERQQSALNFQRFVETFGCELFSSAKYEGEKVLAENALFRLTHIPVKPGVKRRVSLFHIGGYVPYSDNLFRLLPSANLFDRFIENGIDVYEMKLKCDKTQYNANMLEMTVAGIIESVHELSDIAFAHNNREPMILEGYCGTGVHTYTSYLADIENMAKKFRLILTFVSPLDARKCTIFEQLHEVLAYINPQEGPVEGSTISSLLDTIQDRNFEKTPMGTLMYGWKNKEYAKVQKLEDLSIRQQSELVAWYWLSLKHGSFYPLSQDLYVFYSRLFANGVSPSGELPYVYKGKALNIVDLKTTGVPVLVFLGDKDHLVDCHTADILGPLLGDQAKVVVHQKTGHVAYIFNPNRWQKGDARAFTPDVIETIFNSLGVTEMAKEKAKETKDKKVAAKPAAKAAAKPAAKAAAKPAAKAAAKPAAKAAAKPAAKAAAKPAAKAAAKPAAKAAAKPAAKAAAKPAAKAAAKPAAKAAAKPAAKAAAKPAAKAAAKPAAKAAAKPAAKAAAKPAAKAAAKPAAKAAAKPAAKAAAKPAAKAAAKPAAKAAAKPAAKAAAKPAAKAAAKPAAKAAAKPAAKPAAKKAAAKPAAVAK